MQISFILFQGSEQMQPDGNTTTTSSQKLMNAGLLNCCGASTFAELISQAQLNKNNSANSLSIVITSLNTLKIVYKQSRTAMKDANIYGKVLLLTNENGRDYLLKKDIYLQMNKIILKACVNEQELVAEANRILSSINELGQNLGYEEIDEQKISNSKAKSTTEIDGLQESFFNELVSIINKNNDKQLNNSYQARPQSIVSKIQNILSLSSFTQQIFQFEEEKKKQEENKVQKREVKPEENKKQRIEMLWIDANMPGNQISINELNEKYEYKLKIKQFTSVQQGENYLIESYLKNKELVHLMVFSNSLAASIFESSYFPYPSVVEMVIYCGNQQYAQKNCRKHGVQDIVEFTKSPSKLKQIISRKMKKYQLNVQE